MDDKNTVMIVEKLNELVEKMNDLGKFCKLTSEILELYEQKVKLIERLTNER